MKKYSKQLILDYISGNDLKFDVEELEDNMDFMIEVLRLTRDKKMYHYCSNDLKNNCEFIIELLKIFRDDQKFCYQLSYNYLVKKSSNTIKKIELMLLISDILKGNPIYNDFREACLKKVGTFYLNETFNVSLEIVFGKSMGLVGENDRGFYLIHDSFQDSAVVINYFAKRFMKEILYNNGNGYTFEELIHANFKSIEDLQEYGIYNFFIKFISQHDYFLGSYIALNKDLLKEFIGEITWIEKNWSCYIKRINVKKFDLLIEEINKEDFLFYDLVLGIIIKELHLENEYHLYLEDIKKHLDEEFPDIYDCFSINDDFIVEDELDFLELKKVHRILQFARKLFSKDVIDKTNMEEKISDFKLVKYDFQKGK